jgi:type I restriction enzyme M protein
MDYSHYAAEHHSSVKQAKLGDLEVLRGTVEVGSARRLGASLIHTTDIQGGNVTWSGDRVGELPDSTVRARQGDLLLARVGRKFFAKIAVLDGDEAPLSDCVFAIRSNTYESSQLFGAFTSEAGQQWLQAHARGACAQYITKDDLQMFPVAEFIK